MEKVIISSVMRDYSSERIVVRNAVESLGLRALMAETAPASLDASRQALLPLVEQSDALVLVLGARYGFISAPTVPDECRAGSVRRNRDPA
jgi:hypothetical protein